MRRSQKTARWCAAWAGSSGCAAGRALGPVLGARVLAEFGDDPTRYDGARARKNYAGTSPITRASGKKKVVLARYVRNNRLADALHQHPYTS